METEWDTLTVFAYPRVPALDGTDRVDTRITPSTSRGCVTSSSFDACTVTGAFAP